MLSYSQAQEQLKTQPKRWLVTGCAGFIGSNICHKLLSLGQTVMGLDNFSTGPKTNIQELQNTYPNFEFVEGDIRNLEVLEDSHEKPTMCSTKQLLVLSQDPSTVPGIPMIAM